MWPCRACATFVAWRLTPSTGEATTRWACASSWSSRRSSTTRLTRFAAWRSRSSPRPAATSRAAGCCNCWACRLSREARSHGEEINDQPRAAPQVCCARAPPLRTVRPPARLPAPFPFVPYLLPRTGPRRKDPRRGEEFLVKAEEESGMYSDPIADMLTRIRNALIAGHASVSVPGSQLKQSIAQILREEGFIDDFAVVTTEDSIQPPLRLRLKYVGVRREKRPVIP